MSPTEEDERLWREGEQALQSLLASLARARLLAEAAGESARCVLLNAVQYAAIFNYDLRQLLFDIEKAGDTWKGRLYVRLLALTLYECMEDLRALLGRSLRDAIAQLSDPQSLDRLSLLHATATHFFETHRPTLLEIRLQVIGHREHDAQIQLRRLEAIDIDQIVGLGHQMVKWLSDFHEFVTSINQRRDLHN